jgi:hypothetical protein
MSDRHKLQPLIFTGTGSLVSHFFKGDVTLQLDVLEGTLTAFTPQLAGFGGLADAREAFDAECEHPTTLCNVQIVLPLGRLHAKELTGLEFRSYRPGTLSVYNTYLSSVFQLREMTGLSALTLIPAAQFLDFTMQTASTEGGELIYSSHGVSTSPVTVCKGQKELVADDVFTHFQSKEERIDGHQIVHLA